MIDVEADSELYVLVEVLAWIVFLTRYLFSLWALKISSVYLIQVLALMMTCCHHALLSKAQLVQLREPHMELRYLFELDVSWQ